MQGGQYVNATQLDFVFFLVVGLRVGLRLDKTGQETLTLAIDIYNGITAGGTEKVGGEVLHEEAHGSLILEQYVERVAYLTFNFHGVVRPVDAAAFGPDFEFFCAVVPGDDMYLDALVLFVIKVSVYVHCLNFYIRFPPADTCFVSQRQHEVTATQPRLQSSTAVTVTADERFQFI